MFSGKKGVTLVELLLVTALLSAVFVGLGLSFVMGLRVFDRVTRLSADEGVYFFFEKITTDLKNYASYHALAPRPSKDSLVFATFKPQDETSALPMEVQYRWDARNHEVIRAESDPVYHAFDPKSESVASGVRNLSFSYTNAEDGSMDSVSVTVEIQDGRDTRTFEKKIMIPSRYALA